MREFEERNTRPPFHDGDPIKPSEKRRHRGRNDADVRIFLDGDYPAMEVKSEITIEVKLTLNPLWLNKVQNIIPRDSPQLTKQKTSKRTKKNDSTVSAVSRMMQENVLGKPGMSKNRVQIVPITNSNGISSVR